MTRSSRLGIAAQRDPPLPGSLERGVLSLEAPRTKTSSPTSPRGGSAAGLADVAPAGGRIVPRTIRQQRVRAGKREVGPRLSPGDAPAEEHRTGRGAFLRTLETSQEWVDLELLLRELTELGARPLLLSMPIHGGWYDQCGVRYTARRAYYQKLREIGARYHAAVVDFADHDADRSFCRDRMGHLRSRSGWCITARSSTVSSTTRSRPSPNSPRPPRRIQEPIARKEHEMNRYR